MKTRLPLSLLKALLKSLRAVTCTTLCSGALLAGGSIWLCTASATEGTQPSVSGQLQDEKSVDKTQTADKETLELTAEEKADTDKDAAIDELLKQAEILFNSPRLLYAWSPEITNSVYSPFNVAVGGSADYSLKDTPWWSHALTLQKIATRRAAGTHNSGNAGNGGSNNLHAAENDKDAENEETDDSSTTQLTLAAASAPAPASYSTAAVESYSIPVPVPAARNRSYSGIATIGDSDNTLIWVGDGNWSTGADDWAMADGSPATTAPSITDTALFDDSATIKDVNVSSSKNIGGMTVTGSGYVFSGGGNISIEGALTVNMEAGSSTQPNTLTFGSTSHIEAGSIELSSGANTLTTFNASVTADSLTISNGGQYVFNYTNSSAGNDAISIAGAASITLDAESSSSELLTVKGSISAGSLTLGGTAGKHFESDVTTTSGNLIISAHTGEVGAFDGDTSFLGNVLIAEGGILEINNNAKATFSGTVASAAGEGQLETVLNQGVMVVNTYLSSMSSGEAYDLGTITLEGLGILELNTRSVVEFDLADNGHKFILNGSARRADITLVTDNRSGDKLANGSDITVNGGNVNLYSGGGQVGGTLTVDGASTSVNLRSDYLFADDATGISVVSGTLNLGSTKQSIPGAIDLQKGGTISGGTLEVPEDAQNENKTGAITYSGANNTITGTAMDSNGFTLTVEGQGEGSSLTLTGGSTLTGEGTLLFTGTGTTTIDTELKYAGSITVENGSTVELVNNKALYNAKSLTVGKDGNLAITHNGEPVQVNGNVTLSADATLTFNNLSSHKGHTEGALAITGGGLYFNTQAGDNVSIAFNEVLENFSTYTLVTSDTSINFSSGEAGQQPGSVTIFMGGTEVEGGQYEFSFSRDGDQSGDTRYLYFTTMFGNQWVGKPSEGETLNWHDAEGSTTSNWVLGQAGFQTNNLFRELTNDDASLINSVSIEFDQTPQAKKLYVDGRTNYTIDGKGNGFLRGTTLTKRGAASSTNPLEEGQGILTFANIQSYDSKQEEWADNAMGDIMVEGGELHLMEGTRLGVTEESTIHIALQNTVAGVEMTGKLLIDVYSYLLLQALDPDGEAIAYIKGNKATAQLAGIDINGTTITGTGNASASTGTLTSYISNATIAGATLENVALTGTGSLNNSTLSTGAQFGPGSQYDLAGEITLSSTIRNDGTLSFDTNRYQSVYQNGTYQEVLTYQGVVLNINNQAVGSGSSSTYTLFSGGTYLSWSELETNNFRFNGVRLDTINGVTVDTQKNAGQVTLTADGLKFVTWDNAWEPYLQGEIKPAIAIDVEKSSDSSSSQQDETIYLVSGDRKYAYNNRLADGYKIEGGDDVHTISIGAGVGDENSSIYGLSGTVTEAGSIWINSEGADFGQITAGYSQVTSGDFFALQYTGDSYLQIVGDHQNTKQIIAGSNTAKQIGNSFLSFADGSDGSNASFINSEIITGNYIHPGIILRDPQNVELAVHEGNSFLHIAGTGSYNVVYAGSFCTYTKGTTSALIDGGTIAILHGGDVTFNQTTHTGDVVVDLKGGVLAHVYAAGGTAWNSGNWADEDNQNTVDGNATISLYVGADGQMLTRFQNNSTTNGAGATTYLAPLLYGGEELVTGTSTLNFANAGFYYLDGNHDADGTLNLSNSAGSNLAAVDIERFDQFTLTNGAHVTVRADKFNTTNALTISGAGVVEVTAGSENRNTVAHDVTLKDGTTLHLNTSYYQSTSTTSTPSTITATAGTTIDASYTGFIANGEKQNAMNVALRIEGTGVNNQGAIYKGSGGGLAEGISFPLITLTNHATMNLATGTDFYMVAAATNGESSTEFSQTTLDLHDGGNSERGYVLTLTGGGTLGLYYTAITGGTLDVTGKSTVESNLNSAAGDTDLVLRNGTTLLLTHKTYTEGNLSGFYGYESNDNPASYNGFAVESLSGSGSINLSNHGWLYINMTESHGGFDTALDPTGLAGYAYYSGTISDSGAGRVSLAGTDDAEEHFTGSESTYRGGTSVLGGTLYLDGSSTARQFSKGVSVVEKGVIGSATTSTDPDTGEVMLTDNGTLTWQGGTVYLGDGVNIFNDGMAATQTVTEGTQTSTQPCTIRLGVASHIVTEGTKTSTTYDVATWSGVLRNTTADTTGTLEKVGGGTLILTQDGTFTGDVAVKEGSLNLRRWVDAGDYSSITVSRGASLVFTYDNTGVDDAGQVNEITSFNTNITIAGTGDTRWETLGENTRTAALSSGIAAGKTLEIAGIIQDETRANGTKVETISGNLLHSGSGTLVLSGANTYSGGTTIDGGGLYANGTVIVKHSKGLGSTANGGTATLTTAANTRIEFVNNVDANGDIIHETETTLAATGNAIHGAVSVGEGASLTMAGDGYYANRTELEEGSSLVFSSKNASNWDGITTHTSTDTGTNYAGTLAGCGTLVVQGEETKVYFQETDSLHDGETGFAGNMVVMGDAALLHIQGGELGGGCVQISGEGATVSARRSEVHVTENKFIALSSTSSEEGKQATLQAHEVSVGSGAEFTISAGSASAADIDIVNETAASTLTVEEALDLDVTATKPQYIYAPNYDGGYHLAYNPDYAQNTAAHVAVETQAGFMMEGGAIYDFTSTNTSLSGGALTLNVTEDAKIILSGGSAFDEYLAGLAGTATADDSTPDQWVLFSDVGSFTAVLDSLTLAYGRAVADDAESNLLYVMRASDLFSNDYLTNDAVLVYDAEAKVVYLDRATSVRVIPEPATATLSLLALAALAARRRRRND